MDTNWAALRKAARDTEQREWEQGRERREWLDHFNNCGDRVPCSHAG